MNTTTQQALEKRAIDAEAMLSVQMKINHKLHDNLEKAEAEIVDLRLQLARMQLDSLLPQVQSAQSTAHAAASR
jgi:hypothetical protein